MALQTNIITYDKIMIPLRDKLRNEFEGSLPVYIDSKHKNIGSKYLRIFIDSQSLFTRRAKAFTNLYDTNDGYSGNLYDVDQATKNRIIYPSLDPSIFELKYPNTDIEARAIGDSVGNQL